MCNSSEYRHNFFFKNTSGPPYVNDYNDGEKEENRPYRPFIIVQK